MKCFAVLPMIFAVTLGSFLQDTPEVAAAKNEFYRAYQAAASAAAASSPNARFDGASAPAAPAAGGIYDDGQTYPAAEPYVHEEPPYNGGGGQYSSPSYSAPAPAAPAPTYAAPAPTYAAQAPSYAAQAPTYAAQAPSYSAPAPSYAAPSYAAVPAAAPAASYGGQATLNYDNRAWNNICYNNLGDGVECRKLGKQY